MRSDNGPQFSSIQFADFAREWNFEHETSSPHHPQANGFAEAMVKIVKQALQKAKYSGTDPHLALLSLRGTPIDHNIQAPTFLLYNRKIRSNLPFRTVRNSQLEDVQRHLEQRQTLQKEHHDKSSSARIQQPLYAGQAVSVYDTQRRIWIPATVLRKFCDGSCLVKFNSGTIARRARIHLRERHIKSMTGEPVSSYTPTSDVPQLTPQYTATPTATELPIEVASEPSQVLDSSQPTSIPAETSPPAQPDVHTPPVIRRSTRTRKTTQRLITEI